MTVHVTHIYGEHTNSYSGDEESVLKQLLAKYDFLNRYKIATVHDAVVKLSQTQSLIVNVE